MKKFILGVCALVLILFLASTAYYRFGFYVDLHPEQPVTTFMTADETTIYMTRDGVTEPFEIRSVNLGAGIPGKWASDYAIDKETYLRWFGEIQALGANSIRVYTILQDDFYNAFYEYNQGREEPLYLLQGVWVNDYVQNSHRDAYDDEFCKALADDCKTVVDIIHGKKSLAVNSEYGSGRYRHDISDWVIGYIPGVEWLDLTVAYTNEKYPERNSYSGEYMCTTDDASAFEAMLCEVGDTMIAYESKRYKEQRLIGFSNWPATDPFTYPDAVAYYFLKCAKVDVEHIKTTEAFQSGHFASYHVYPYYPDYLNFMPDKSGFDQTADGRLNTYSTYLKQLADHHTIPVVISEYGVSTGRGMAQRDVNTGRNQGYMSEQEQGQALIDCYNDIMAAGCAGSSLFIWQDEWFKRTWNTMHAVDLDQTPYWSDYQTNEQYFGLLAFDPGEESSVCYVDGDVSEWTSADLVTSTDELSLSIKYDEKFVYLLAHKADFDPTGDTLYIPIDTTPKTGSTYSESHDVAFERASDFLLVIDGSENSRLLVQERYEVLRAMYLQSTAGLNPYTNPPAADTPIFKPIDMILQTTILRSSILGSIRDDMSFETYETGKLTHGNANPESADYNSLADFMIAGDYVEIKLPWQLLNFGNPSQMQIHDDYYEHYGIEYITVDEMYAGIGASDSSAHRIPMAAFRLKGWDHEVTYHERLKESYYIMQEYWSSLDNGTLDNGTLDDEISGGGEQSPEPQAVAAP